MVPSIWLPSGRYFNFIDLDSNVWDIEDIAHNLSMICRFNGSIPKFYSVAEHSVYVMRQVHPELRLAALLHDAHEAWMGDVTSPLKSLLPDFRTLENRIQAHTLKRFGIDHPLHQDIHVADKRVYISESIQLRGVRDDSYSWEPAEITIEAYEPAVACAWFLDEFRSLMH